MPPYSGNFTFSVHCLYPAILMVSKLKFGSMEECAGHSQVDGSPRQPVSLTLEKGGAYYLEASTLFSYGVETTITLAVGVTLPDGTFFQRIPDRYCTP